MSDILAVLSQLPPEVLLRLAGIFGWQGQSAQPTPPPTPPPSPQTNPSQGLNDWLNSPEFMSRVERQARSERVDPTYLHQQLTNHYHALLRESQFYEAFPGEMPPGTRYPLQLDRRMDRNMPKAEPRVPPGVFDELFQWRNWNAPAIGYKKDI